jgi:hypothetical protein
MAILDLRPNCECCDRDLSPDSDEAMICTFECTFCADCGTGHFAGTCPNCGGNLVPRPIRPAAGPTGGLGAHPPATERVNSSTPCPDRSH